MRINSLRCFGKTVLAATLVLLVIVSAMAAGSSELHKKLHSDHASPTHACLASALEQGHGHGPVAALPLFLPPASIVRSHLSEAVTPNSTQFRLFSGRGPPCLS